MRKDEAPKTIWAYPKASYGYHQDDYRSWSVEKEYSDGVKYRRADTPPTLKQAMELPEVKALIEVGDVMAHLLWEHPIVPSSVRKWVAAVAPFKGDPT